MLVALDRDRIRVLVATFRFAGQGNVQVARDKVEDVVQDCYLRMLGMLAGFKGAVLPQYEAAMATCTDFECRDHCRREMRLDQHSGGSLDEQVQTDDGGTRGKFESVVGKQERARLAEERSSRTGDGAMGRAPRAGTRQDRAHRERQQARGAAHDLGREVGRRDHG